MEKEMEKQGRGGINRKKAIWNWEHPEWLYNEDAFVNGP